jgi:hypothetical protein
VADTISRLRRDLFELREDLLELLVAGQQDNVGITLEAFARLVNLSPATMRKQIRSSDPAVRSRWPRFYRPEGGRSDEHTTLDDVGRWRAERCRSSHPCAPGLSAPHGARRRRPTDRSLAEVAP